MKTYMRIILALAVATLLLAGLGAGPQSANTATKGKDSGNAQTTSTASGQKSTADGGASSRLQAKKSNPLYEDKGEGTNPLYEGRDSVAKSNGTSTSGPQEGSAQTNKAPSTGSTASSGVVEYKDGDDATARYRPGNNKTATVKPSGKTGSSGVVEYKDGEDGTTRTQPSNPK
jgi:hypothetical protein